MTINCIIVDDEIPALEILETHIRDIPYLNLVAKCNNALEAFRILNSEKIELIFLDVSMPEINGLQFIQSLKNPPNVILTTAYTKYALEGYKVNALDYLLKPISFTNLFEASNKARQLIEGKEKKNNSVSVELTKQAPYFFVKSNKKIIKIYLDDLLYIESQNDFLALKCQSVSPKIVIYGTLKKIKEKLPTDNFIQVHRSYIIAIEKINYISDNTIKIDTIEIPIGNTYKAALEEFIQQKMLL